MGKQTNDQSINTIPTLGRRVMGLIKAIDRELFFFAVFMLAFLGGMAITNGRPFLSALCAAVLSAALVSPLLRSK